MYSQKKIPINIPQILAILDYNAFSNEPNAHSQCHAGIKSSNKSSGLWIFPSYFNHACMPNLNRIFMSDLMLIYTKTNISAGEELTISYIGFDPSYESRKLKLKNYEFECDCLCCRKDQQENSLKKERIEIIQKVIQLKKNKKMQFFF